MSHVNANAANFYQEVIQSDIPVLVDFWSDYCPPCRALKPVLQRLAEEYEGEFKLVLVDVEAEQEVAQRFGVRGLPTLMLFKNGSPAAVKMGYESYGALANWIEAWL